MPFYRKRQSGRGRGQSSHQTQGGQVNIVSGQSERGSGTSAKIASIWAKGELNLEETYVTESIIGSLFYAKLIREVRVGNFKAAVPEITGRAFIIGSHTFVIDEDDPFKYGFRL